jgi:kynureninase
LYNAEQITDWAHQNGALVLWDLSHATGAVEIQLNKINADLAVGCTYKYLNGGPGSPAFLFVKSELQEKLTSPIQGWFGNAQPFQFDLQYKAAKGIKKFLAGTPPIISMLATEPGIDLLLKAGIKNIQQKSKLQSENKVLLWVLQ